MDSFPTHFHDERLLTEVINPIFYFYQEPQNPTYHTQSGCRKITSRVSLMLVPEEPSKVDPSYHCPHCMRYGRPPTEAWSTAPRVSGQALYSITRGPNVSERVQDRDLRHQIIARIINHYQVATLPQCTTRDDVSWLTKPDQPHAACWTIAIVPDQLSKWVTRFVGRARPLGIAGPVCSGDTLELLECAIGLWEKAEDGPLSQLATALAAARTIFN